MHRTILPAFRAQLGLRLVSLLVGLNGLLIVITTLLELLELHHGTHASIASVDVPLLVGLSLLYLSTLLRRQKQTAWLVTALAYMFYVGLNVATLITHMDERQLGWGFVLRSLVIPLSVLLLLLVLQPYYTVRSDLQGFRGALRFSGYVLLVALLYGILGYTLLDKTDFHEEIGFRSATIYTLEEFGIPLGDGYEHAYTRRARIFEDSLTFVGVGAAFYVAISLFQPLRVRLVNQDANRTRVRELLKRYGGSSEEFFKLWPHDKQYFFDSSQQSALAFHVYHGTALCVGGPIGDERRFVDVVSGFQAVCFGNDWRPAFINVSSEQRAFYEQQGYSLQRIGQEALVDIGSFTMDVAHNKYFRQINNRFTRLGYSCQLLQPPHSNEILAGLKTISEQWLAKGGRAERGFAMGYFSDAYMQQCSVMVCRDAEGSIKGFLNQLPADFNAREANFDLLRHAPDSPGNVNDFLLLSFIQSLSTQGYQTLNLGLCPLTGLTDEADGDTGLLDTVLHFAYANGDRFYSFSGLHRFKAKYRPQWRDRYIAYQGGLGGFSRTATALMRTMRVKT